MPIKKPRKAPGQASDEEEKRLVAKIDDEYETDVLMPAVKHFKMSKSDLAREGIRQMLERKDQPTPDAMKRLAEIGLIDAVDHRTYNCSDIISDAQTLVVQTGQLATWSRLHGHERALLNHIGSGKPIDFVLPAEAGSSPELTSSSKEAVRRFFALLNCYDHTPTAVAGIFKATRFFSTWMNPDAFRLFTDTIAISNSPYDLSINERSLVFRNGINWEGRESVGFALSQARDIHPSVQLDPLAAAGMA
ncbi:hypothetical protein [Mesorhizobium sp. B2-3-4]|uniref:hypothetical protein n=1 Tax=Mesorhizobium sp. B2-3-4 TaxID=2589959 RepID=UPI001126FE89|nr:hypothetical protein [Mesorhizobium sp. B2-3-4]TPM41434.1 hypothetical protein FJ967_00410 [Mesorhizobium sp. B2-3-4]